MKDWLQNKRFKEDHVLSYLLQSASIQTYTIVSYKLILIYVELVTLEAG